MRRLVAGRVTPTRLATSLTRTPSCVEPMMRSARHCGNVISKPGVASASARVVTPTAPTQRRSSRSAKLRVSHRASV